MDLAFMVYKTTELLPREELYGLSDQMRRAVVSIPSNIAEGCQRGSIKEYIHFLYIAKGSLAELETQILLCKGFGYINKEQTDSIEAQCIEITKMLNVLINNLQQKINKGDIKKVIRTSGDQEFIQNL